MKVLLFTIIKNYNQWLDEWAKHHLDIGFSLLIYDNNDGLNDYLMSEYIISECTNKHIKMINKRNKKLSIANEFRKVFDEYKENYDYIMFLNQDEYVILKNDSSIHNILAKCNKTVIVKKYLFNNEKIDYKNLFYYKDIKIVNTSESNETACDDLYIKKLNRIK